MAKLVLYQADIGKSIEFVSHACPPEMSEHRTRYEHDMKKSCLCRVRVMLVLLSCCVRVLFCSCRVRFAFLSRSNRVPVMFVPRSCCVRVI